MWQESQSTDSMDIAFAPLARDSSNRVDCPGRKPLFSCFQE